MRTLDLLYAAALLSAAGYLVATRRRSRRAAMLGLGGVALLGLNVLMYFADTSAVKLLASAGWADATSRRVVAPWRAACHRGLAYGLLIGAVLIDRRPPAADE